MDNGKGFDLKCDYKDHYGLENIYQRSKEINAKLSIESDPKKGTHVALNKELYNSSELYSNTNVSNNFNS
jgi:nitrate/nitrite-specific signal transduction histidine kinase